MKPCHDLQVHMEADIKAPPKVEQAIIQVLLEVHRLIMSILTYGQRYSTSFLAEA